MHQIPLAVRVWKKRQPCNKLTSLVYQYVDVFDKTPQACRCGFGGDVHTCFLLCSRLEIFQSKAWYVKRNVSSYLGCPPGSSIYLWK